MYCQIVERFVYDEFERIWKKAVMAFFKKPPRNLDGETEKDHKKDQYGRSTSQMWIGDLCSTNQDLTCWENRYLIWNIMDCIVHIRYSNLLAVDHVLGQINPITSNSHCFPVALYICHLYQYVILFVYDTFIYITNMFVWKDAFWRT
jgi:hypothetical protein